MKDFDINCFVIDDVFKAIEKMRAKKKGKNKKDYDNFEMRYTIDGDLDYIEPQLDLVSSNYTKDNSIIMNYSPAYFSNTKVRITCKKNN